MRGVPGENIVSGVLNLVLMVGVVRASVMSFKGRKASLGQSLGAASNFMGLLGLSILMNLAIFVGLILLIIPGLILYAVWAVAMPAKIEEGLGVTEAFSRSKALTQGYRPTIIGLTLIWSVVAMVAYAILLLVAAFVLPFGTVGDLVSEVVIVPLFVTSFAVLSATVSAALYYELKRLKEGDETLAAIFS